jgi:hypothetical protein
MRPLLAFTPLLLCASTSLLVACGGSDPPPGGTPDTYAPPPSSAIVDDGAVKIRREIFLVPGVKAPKNPLAKEHAETPAELEMVRVVRYRVDAATPKPARAIAVLMPGFLGGAGSYDALARALVRRSTEERGLRGLGHRSSLQPARRSPRPRRGRGEEGPGARREILLRRGRRSRARPSPASAIPRELAFASEWGLPVTIGDLHNVIGMIGEADRKARVILVGHSLGASIVEEYAAWDFDGKARLRRARRPRDDRRPHPARGRRRACR